MNLNLWHRLALMSSLLLASLSSCAGEDDVATLRTDWRSYPAVKTDGTFRVLAIGNSFTEDFMAHLPGLLRLAEADSVMVCKATVPGTSLEYHLDQVSRQDNEYSFQESVGGSPFADAGGSPTTLKTCVDYADWDVIIVQQLSYLSGDYSTIAPFLTPLIDNLRHGHPRAQIVWHETWSYARSYDGAVFERYGHSQATMDSMIVDALRHILIDEARVARVVPCGEALRQARAAEAAPMGLTAEGRHLDNRGRTLAAYTLFESLFAPECGVGIGELPPPEWADAADCRKFAAVAARACRWAEALERENIRK